MGKFCPECGHALGADGTCPKCNNIAETAEENKWFFSVSDLDDQTADAVKPTKPIETTPKPIEPPVKPIEPPVKPVEPPVKGTKEKKRRSKKPVIITVCVGLIVVLAVLAWLFGGRILDAFSGQGETTEEKYMDEFSEYVDVIEFDFETNNYGEKIAAAKVECPNYENIYRQVYGDISSEETENKIGKAFFKQASAMLKKNDDFITAEVKVNLSAEDFEKTEKDLWSDTEIEEIIKRKAAQDAFERFCLDIVREKAPEITEEGLLGD